MVNHKPHRHVSFTSVPHDCGFAAAGRKFFGTLTLGILLGVSVPQAQAQLEEAAAAYQAYKTYKQIIEILQSGNPTPEDNILAQLADLKGQMQAIDSKLQTLDQEVAQLVYQDKRDSYIALLRDAQSKEALAQTASQQLLEWVQTGKTDLSKLANAENNSQIAANTLLQRSYYTRPGNGPNDPDIFEYRPTLLPYLYALTVRLGVVAIEQPQFRKFSSYTDEFKNHVIWLKQIPGLLEQEISCQNAKQVDPSGKFAIYSYCKDILSGYESGINGESGNGWNPYITPWFDASDADADNAFTYYTFYDRWRIQEEMGEHAVQNVLPSVIHSATPWTHLEATIAPSLNQGSGPLSSGGKCLDAGPGFSMLNDCNHGSPTQQWTTGNNVAAPISSVNPPSPLLDACIEVYRWQPSSSAGKERCSRSSSEQWNLTTANEIRWGRDSSQCLQADMRLHTCNGSPNQKWFRTWPPLVVPAHH